MPYYLIKLHFNAPVHFGSSLSASSLVDGEMVFRADRLFSALCHTLAHGDPSPQKLCALAKEGKLALSDAFPWKGDEFYLPRPCLESTVQRDTDAADRKVMKKLAYLPLSAYQSFLRSLSGGAALDPHSLTAHFGETYTVIHAAIQDGVDAVPYSVEQFRFDDNCGLYFLLKAEDDATFQSIHAAMRSLGISGIGGKVSSGCGSFTVALACPVGELPSPAAEHFAALLDDSDASCWISLTTCLPRDDELDEALDGALFQLVRRSGFAQAVSLATPNKKREQFFLRAGATFRHRFMGDVYDVAPDGCPHPVYRYGIPLFLGVKQ